MIKFTLSNPYSWGYGHGCNKVLSRISTIKIPGKRTVIATIAGLYLFILAANNWMIK